MKQRNWMSVGKLVISISLISFCLYKIIPREQILFDDAYMFIRYANNILEGYGYSWNRDNIQTFGCTSISYTFLIAFLKVIFPGIEDLKLLITTPKIIGILAILLIVYTCTKIAESKLLKQLSVTSLIIIPLLILNKSFLFHARTGMDTIFSLFTNTLLIFSLYSLNEKASAKYSIFSAFCAYLTFLTRPDNGIFMITFPTLLFIFIFKIRKRLIVYFYITLFLLLFTDTLVKILTFGDPLPLPYYAKSFSFYGDSLELYELNPINYITGFIIYTVPFWLIIIITATKKSTKAVIAYLTPIFLTFAYFFSVMQMVGYFFRFYFPSIPFLIILSMICLDKYFVTNKLTFKNILLKLKQKTPLLIGAILLFFVLRPLIVTGYEKYFLAKYLPKTYQNNFPPNTQLPRLGWLKSMELITEICKKLPKGTIIALSEHGFVGAKNPEIYIIDLIGLHNPEIAHNGFSMSYINSKSPALIWLPPRDYVRMRYEIINDEHFKKAYIFIPYALDYGIAIHRKNVQIYNIVINELKRIYNLKSVDEYILNSKN